MPHCRVLPPGEYTAMILHTSSVYSQIFVTTAAAVFPTTPLTNKHIYRHINNTSPAVTGARGNEEQSLTSGMIVQTETRAAEGRLYRYDSAHQTHAAEGGLTVVLSFCLLMLITN